MKKATQLQIKEHNRTLVLRTIYDQEPVSRTAIAKRTLLTKTTVSEVVAELIEEGFAHEIGRGPSSGGPRPVLLGFLPEARTLLGVDLANDEFRGSLMDLRGNMLASESIAIENSDGAAALEKVYTLIDRLMTHRSSPLLGIGIGSPGLINASEGIVHNAVNLDWKDLPLARLLEQRYQVPVYIANDTQVAAMAEYSFGDHPPIENLAVIKIGIGLSGGFILHGKLYHGDGHGAGEIGHIVVAENGIRCRCGNTGCLETVVSSQAMINHITAHAQQHPEYLETLNVKQIDEIRIRHLYQASLHGDPVIAEYMKNACHYLAISISNLVGILNIETVVLAGMLAKFFAPYLEDIAAEICRRSLSSLSKNTRIMLSSLGDDIVTLGAGSLVLKNELELV